MVYVIIHGIFGQEMHEPTTLCLPPSVDSACGLFVIVTSMVEREKISDRCGCDCNRDSTGSDLRYNHPWIILILERFNESVPFSTGFGSTYDSVSNRQRLKKLGRCCLFTGARVDDHCLAFCPWDHRLTHVELRTAYSLPPDKA